MPVADVAVAAVMEATPGATAVPVAEVEETEVVTAAPKREVDPVAAVVEPVAEDGVPAVAFVPEAVDVDDVGMTTCADEPRAAVPVVVVAAAAAAAFDACLTPAADVEVVAAVAAVASRDAVPVAVTVEEAVTVAERLVALTPETETVEADEVLPEPLEPLAPLAVTADAAVVDAVPDLSSPLTTGASWPSRTGRGVGDWVGGVAWNWRLFWAL
ncbi:MAG: hypothetical protein LC798_05615 [Chloroflexi bacterium]|nr:hypothetical protein [Chloroflexota bacterium]